MTYSVLARDPATGALGAAIQSHWFAVGRETLWSRGAARGMAVVQANVEPSLGMQAMRLFEAGLDDPAGILGALRARDLGASKRQIAVINAHGDLGQFTGAQCTVFAEEACGVYVCAQANMMKSAGVPQAMLQAYASRLDRPFAQRLLAALTAAQRQGGDLRGQQSAAMLISDPRDPPGTHAVDLRVDNSRTPLQDLCALIQAWSAYQALNELGRAPDAAAYDRLRAQTDNPEVLFWAARMMGDPLAPATEGFAELARRLDKKAPPAAQAG